MMAADESFHAWAGKFEGLSDMEALALPTWQQPIAFISQFVLSVMGDGAGSWFYNHTENIEHVARSFEQIGEPDFAVRVRRVESILEPLVQDGPPDAQDILINACLEGAAANEVSALDAAVNERLADIWSKLETTAKANSWTP